jgi:ABC-type bacteriocin/lantibiotic exporter with double-glycine peptidase domain
MKRFSATLRHFRAAAGVRDRAAMLLLFLSAISALIPAFLHRLFFDRVIPDGNRELVARVLFLLVTVESVGILSRFSAERLLCRVTRVLSFQKRVSLADRIGRRSSLWFDREGPGAAVRHYEDAGVLGGLRALVIRDIFGPVLVLAVLLPALVILQPLLAALKLTAALPGMILGRKFLSLDLAYEREIWNERRRIATHLLRGAAGNATLNTFHAAQRYARHLRPSILRQSVHEEKRGVLAAAWESAAGGAGRIGGSLTLAAAVILVMDGRLTFGAYIAFSILSMRAMAALGELFTGIRGFARAGNAAERNGSLSRSETAGPQQASSRCGRSGGNGGLTVSNLRFAYPGSGPVIRNLDLYLDAGEHILVSGVSGAGKSTLFHLLLGLVEPGGGRIEFDGLPMTLFARGFMGTRVGAVLQTPEFFDGTIRENLCMFRPPPPDRRLWSVLEAAAAEDIVAGLPGGLNAVISGEDSGLSGGQRQRLAIARLLAGSPELILLDEPTNALDPAGAAAVLNSLSRACAGKTVLLISHDREVSLEVHRELVLEGGRLHEPGSRTRL